MMTNTKNDILKLGLWIISGTAFLAGLKIWTSTQYSSLITQYASALTILLSFCVMHHTRHM